VFVDGSVGVAVDGEEAVVAVAVVSCCSNRIFLAADDMASTVC
jgi:hypothetical protein